jgi:hypothetical protein
MKEQNHVALRDRSHYEIDHELLNKFLGHVLDRYKAGDTDLATAVKRIAFLVGTVALPGGEGAAPAKYVQNVLAGDFDTF